MFFVWRHPSILVQAFIDQEINPKMCNIIALENQVFNRPILLYPKSQIISPLILNPQIRKIQTSQDTFIFLLSQHHFFHSNTRSQTHSISILDFLSISKIQRYQSAILSQSHKKTFKTKLRYSILTYVQVNNLQIRHFQHF